MNWDNAATNWNQFRGKVKNHWSKLTDAQLDVISGRRSQLVDKIQEAYTITRDSAEEQIKKFEMLNRDVDSKQGPALAGKDTDVKSMGSKVIT